VAYVRGLQSQRIGASVKHYAANNQEYERHRGNSVVDERTLREIYLPAFETIVKETNPWTVMCSYNRINGTYASANEILLRRILKEEWGYEGVVVSDWGAVHDIHDPVTAGLDLEMPGPARYFGQALEAAVNNWQVEEHHVDDAARRMLRTIFRAGVMSEEPLPDGSGDTPAHRSVARDLAAESMVLLKNDQQRLPLPLNDIDKLAVIGMNADREISGGGSSRVDAHHWVTPLAGLREKLGNQIEIDFALGYDNRVDPILVEAESFSHGDEDEPGLKASYYNNLDLSGEPVLTRVEPNLGNWWGGASPEVGVVDGNRFSARWTGKFTASKSGETNFYIFNTGTARVWLDDALILENEVGTVTSAAIDRDRMVAITPVRLEKGKQYSFMAEFSSGEMSQYAFIQFLYMPPLDVEGDLFEEAVTLAKKSDAVVLVVGLPNQYETEGHDRPDMELPGDQDALVRAVAAANPNTIVAVNAGAPVALPWADEVDSIVLMYYPGQEGGHALADILAGEVNPSGKLTVSWPKRLEDNPAYIHYPGWKDVHYGEGLFVGYRYYDAKNVDPLFPFGHGLSYTQFTYSDLRLPDEVRSGENLEVSVTVENTGEVSGQEIVQLYVRDVESTLIRPAKELKGFEKIALGVGESKTLTFELNPRSLSYYDPHQKAWVAEAGIFEVLVGGSSRDIQLRRNFNLVE
ncbi:MAG: glycoside hydrolase family 3 C-terminal domain-containing protein, partial [Brevefilum sp.]